MSKAAIPRGGNDRIMTPDSLALAIVEHFRPDGYTILEPCEGTGAFVRAFEQTKIATVFACEITEGSDFLTWDVPVNWIITNPPWSQFLAFLKRSMAVADDIVFLSYANAWFVKSRINAMRSAGFSFREFAYVANPKKPWPQMGLQLAAVHISRDSGDCRFTQIDWVP
jgi:hypothetical protein